MTECTAVRGRNLTGAFFQPPGADGRGGGYTSGKIWGKYDP